MPFLAFRGDGDFLLPRLSVNWHSGSRIVRSFTRIIVRHCCWVDGGGAWAPDKLSQIQMCTFWADCLLQAWTIQYGEQARWQEPKSPKMVLSGVSNVQAAQQEEELIVPARSIFAQSFNACIRLGQMPFSISSTSRNWTLPEL